jgi:NAD(P)-dependent dehydrogenase (short-subunit alcohol dehydrogenase family)/enamine deaminase RidA (YjgF/YER057c/UK114 family)
MNLEGRVALVTGGGRGIGAETARRLSAAGCRVVVSARSEDEIAAVATSIVDAGGEAGAFTCDVTDESQVERLVASVTEAFGFIDILVNNAGTATSNRLGRTTLEEWDRLLAVNATSAFLCSRAVFDGMAERGWGRIVNIASMAGLEGKRYVSAYTAAKHAVIGLTRAVATEADGTGVTVGAICPGYVDTPLTENTIARVVERTGKSPADALRAVLDAAGQDRLVTMEEVAAAVLDLCADGPDDQNGELIILDGKEGLPLSFDHINPEALGAPKGWTNGMLAHAEGRVLFVAGQDAAEPEGKVTTDDFTTQFGLALEKMLTIVEAAGGRPEDVGRMTIYVTDLDVYTAERKRLGDVYRASMGRHFPAMALVEVKRLVDPRALVEIEAIAVIHPLTP